MHKNSGTKMIGTTVILLNIDSSAYCILKDQRCDLPTLKVSD